MLGRQPKLLLLFFNPLRILLAELSTSGPFPVMVTHLTSVYLPGAFWRSKLSHFCSEKRLERMEMNHPTMRSVLIENTKILIHVTKHEELTLLSPFYFQ